MARKADRPEDRHTYAVDVGQVMGYFAIVADLEPYLALRDFADKNLILDNAKDDPYTRGFVLWRHNPGQKPDAQTTFGCAVGQATVAALKAAGQNPTRGGLVKALESMDKADVSDVIPPLTFTADQHMGATALPLVVIKGDEFSVVTNVSMRTQ